MKRFSSFFLLAILLLPAAGWRGAAADLPVMTGLEAQPLVAQARRLLDALELLGAPLSGASEGRLRQAFAMADDAAVARIIQEVLDPYCLAAVHINPESRVKVAPGPAERVLDQHGWRVFLVKVQNEAGVTAPLQAISPNAQTPFASDWVRTASDR
jgi:hypothetical protein